MHSIHAERSVARKQLAQMKLFIFQANGEIYNHKNIRKQFTGTHNFTTGSDCEVIIPLVSGEY